MIHSRLNRGGMVLLLGLLLALPARAGHAAEPAPAGLEAPEAAIEWFREAGYGLFVHWGPVSLLGTEISWSRQSRRRMAPDWYVWPPDVYDALYRSFYPAQFDARDWMQLAREAGMQYVVLTAKHHDGFSMFDSALTDYDIMSTPYGRDIVGEFAAAAHEAGLRLGFYYSHYDWHHPAYLTENHARYIEFFHGQVRELLTHYGRVDVIWFDLQDSVENVGAPALFEMIRELQPGILVNNRAGFEGDFNTPEQRIGAFENRRPWESCLTLTEGAWAWKPQAAMKSRTELIRALASCVGGDGNLLLNVGPMPTGLIEPRQAARLREVGEWLQEHGQTIHATRGGPYLFSDWGASTHRGDRVWLHLFGWKHDVIELPEIGAEVTGARLLTGPGEARLEKSPQGYRLSVAPADRDPVNTIIELALDRPLGPEPVDPVQVWTLENLATQARISEPADPELGRMLDGDPETAWRATPEDLPVSFVIELPRPARLSGWLLEEGAYNLSLFELEVDRGSHWDKVYVAGWGGQDQKLDFPEGALTTRRVRITLKEARAPFGIREIRLFEAGHFR